MYVPPRQVAHEGEDVEVQEPVKYAPTPQLLVQAVQEVWPPDEGLKYPVEQPRQVGFDEVLQVPLR